MGSSLEVRCSLEDIVMEYFSQEYKRTLGSHLISRREFVRHVHNVRSTKGYLVLPSSIDSFNCRQLIDQELTREVLLRECSQSSEDADATVVVTSIENDVQDRSADFHSHPLEGQGRSPEPEKKKTKRRI
jgi:hypothetical protein